MPTRTTCPHCKVAITFLDAQVGTSLTCPQCSVSWVFTATEDSGNESRNSPAGNRDSAYKIACPKCSAVTKLPQAAGGHLMTCKRCAAQVVLPHPTNVHKAVASSAVETECTRCSRCYSIAAQGQFEWTECPGCGVVSVARPKSSRAAPLALPPPPPRAAVAGSQLPGANFPTTEETFPALGQSRQADNCRRSRRNALWVVGVGFLIVCVSGAVLYGVRVRQGELANPWNAVRRERELSLPARELVTFLKECGAVQDHTVSLAFRDTRERTWQLTTSAGTVYLFEFDEEIDARVSSRPGCQIGLMRLSPAEDVGGYVKVLNALLSSEANARLSLSDETKTRFKSELKRVNQSREDAKMWERNMKEAMKRMEEEMKKARDSK